MCICYAKCNQDFPCYNQKFRWQSFNNQFKFHFIKSLFCCCRVTIIPISQTLKHVNCSAVVVAEERVAFWSCWWFNPGPSGLCAEVCLGNIPNPGCVSVSVERLLICIKWFHLNYSSVTLVFFFWGGGWFINFSPCFGDVLKFREHARRRDTIGAHPWIGNFMHLSLNPQHYQPAGSF